MEISQKSSAHFQKKSVANWVATTWVVIQRVSTWSCPWSFWWSVVCHSIRPPRCLRLCLTPPRQVLSDQGRQATELRHCPPNPVVPSELSDKLPFLRQHVPMGRDASVCCHRFPKASKVQCTKLRLHANLSTRACAGHGDGDPQCLCERHTGESPLIVANACLQ